MPAPAAHLVCLPGWMFPATAFEPLRDLCPVTYGWRALDGSVALRPEVLRATLTQAPSPCVLVAWSLGALAALRLAADPPPALAGLVLLGATARLTADPTTGYAGISPAVLSAMRRRLSRDPAGTFADFHALCHRPTAATPDDAAAFVAVALAQDPGDADAGLAALASWDLRALAPTIHLPVVLIHGEVDAVVPVGQAHALAAALPRGEVRTLPHVGHAVTPAVLAEVAAEVAHIVQGGG